MPAPRCPAQGHIVGYLRLLPAAPPMGLIVSIGSKIWLYCRDWQLLNTEAENGIPRQHISPTASVRMYIQCSSIVQIYHVCYLQLGQYLTEAPGAYLYNSLFTGSQRPAVLGTSHLPDEMPLTIPACCFQLFSSYSLFLILKLLAGLHFIIN